MRQVSVYRRYSICSVSKRRRAVPAVNRAGGWGRAVEAQHNKN